MKIKYPAVIVAALVHYLLGGLWYSPLLFANKFIQIIGWTPQQIAEMQAQGPPVKELVIALVTSLVLVYILAHVVQYTKAKNWRGGLETGFWLWLGFVATTQLATVIFEKRPLGLYLINIGYQLVGCMLAGVILAVWRPQEATQPAAQAA